MKFPDSNNLKDDLIYFNMIHSLLLIPLVCEISHCFIKTRPAISIVFSIHSSSPFQTFKTSIKNIADSIDTAMY